jgi:hypothetical protein
MSNVGLILIALFVKASQAFFLKIIKIALKTMATCCPFLLFLE